MPHPENVYSDGSHLTYVTTDTSFRYGRSTGSLPFPFALSFALADEAPDNVSGYNG
jgi:hypothetical protein